MHPTITRIGAVAALGIAETNGESTALEEEAGRRGDHNRSALCKYSGSNARAEISI